MPRKPSHLETIHEAEIGFRIAIGVRRPADKWTVPPKESPESRLLTVVDPKKLWRVLQNYLRHHEEQIARSDYPPVPYIVIEIPKANGQSTSRAASGASAAKPSIRLHLVSQAELEDWGCALFWLEVESSKDLKAAARTVDKDNSETERNTDGNGSETEFEDLSEIDESEYTGGTGPGSTDSDQVGWI